MKHDTSTNKKKLGDWATARSGDKGNHVNLGVVARDAASYNVLADHLTSERIARFFSTLQPRKIERYLLPKIGALNFLLYDVLDGGASASLRSDTQGKLLGTALLEMPFDGTDGANEAGED